MTAPGPTTAVVVTGGASGIGRATCLTLAEAGRAVAAWDRNAEGAEATAAECRSRFGVAAVGVGIDVSRTVDLRPAVDRSLSAVGPIGGLVHAAGVGGAGPIDTIDDASWDAVLDVNVRAQALIVQALLPALREANPGSAIVGISSVEAFTGNEMLTAYCASKAALLGLTRALAHRLGRDAIRVNAVCPGAVDTPMLGRFLAIEGARRRLEQRVPLGRIADPDELARVVRFLLSDDASYIHGAAVTVDGGLTAVG